jgi:hypothetical protein
MPRLESRSVLNVPLGRSGHTIPSPICQRRVLGQLWPFLVCSAYPAFAVRAFLLKNSVFGIGTPNPTRLRMGGMGSAKSRTRDRVCHAPENLVRSAATRYPSVVHQRHKPVERNRSGGCSSHVASVESCWRMHGKSLKWASSRPPCPSQGAGQVIPAMDGQLMRPRKAR